MLVKVLGAAVAVLVVLVVLLGSLAFVSYRRARMEMERARAAEMQARLEAERNLAEAKELAERIRAEQARAEAAALQLGEAVEVAESRQPAGRAAATTRDALAEAREWFAADPDNWRTGLAAAQRLAREFEPAVAVAALRELYPQLSVAHREQLFKPFVFDGGHPLALDVLDLGARDAEGSVRERAFLYLRNYAFCDFSADQEAYDAWQRASSGLPLAEVLDRSSRSAVERLGTLQGEALAREMRVLSDLDLRAARKYGTDVVASLRAAGLPALVGGWLASGEPRDVVFGLRAAGWLDLDARAHAELVDRALARDWSRPQPIEITSEYCRLVGARGNDWAVDRLLDITAANLGESADENESFAPCGALGTIADTRAIPRLIEMLQQHDTPGTRYSVGYYALRPLTGVSHDATHDAAWWSEWWERNRSSYEK
jgi:hypothetical protein